VEDNLAKHYHKNPRQITRKQFDDLRESLRRLGDLSGVVHDLGSDEIIGGNQRMDVFDIKTAEIEITEQFEQPDEQGTIARGWVIWQGKKYTYRAVMWDEKTREEANIRANKAGGTWDMDTLANQFEIPDLIEWGFSEGELGLIGDIPTLEELEAEHGEPGERDFWPYVRVQVSPETMEKFKAVMATLPGADEAEKFDALVSGGCR
jgi:hypothetical protein